MQLSEIGVSLLMFGVGLHFSIKDLWAVRRIAVPGAIVRIVLATFMGALLVRFWGLPWAAGIVFGLCLSVSSTVVLVRALTERRQIDTANGRIAVGWLIVEDIISVVALVVLPPLAGVLGGVAPGGVEGGALATLGSTLLKVGAFVAAMMIIGTRVIPRVLGRVARTGSHELFTLGVLAIALGVAFGAQSLFGVSPALGAFFAGVVIAESDLSYQAGAETLPLQEAFAVLFFVAVGMLFDPAVLVDRPVQVLLVLFIVMVGKALASAVIVLLFRYPIGTALTISASLAQIGEFSFILIGLAVSLEILPEAARSLIVAAAILSIGLNPVVFSTIAPIDRWFRKHPRLLRRIERSRKGVGEYASDHSGLRDHAVMIGYGRVGALIGAALRANNVPFSVVEIDKNVVDELRRHNVHAVFGDAARPGVLAHTHIRSARLLVVATPDALQAREIIDYARKVNPDIEVCVRTHSFEEERYYEEIGADNIVMGERELGLQMAHYVLTAFGKTEEEADLSIDEQREQARRDERVE